MKTKRWVYLWIAEIGTISDFSLTKQRWSAAAQRLGDKPGSLISAGYIFAMYPGADSPRVCCLRSLSDCRAIIGKAAAAGRVVLGRRELYRDGGRGCSDSEKAPGPRHAPEEVPNRDDRTRRLEMVVCPPESSDGTHRAGITSLGGILSRRSSLVGSGSPPIRPALRQQSCAAVRAIMVMPLDGSCFRGWLGEHSPAGFLPARFCIRGEDGDGAFMSIIARDIGSSGNW